MSELPNLVRDLLSERVATFEQLEILLLLRTHPGRTWTARELAREVKLHEEAVVEALAALVNGTLVRRQEGSGKPLFSYLPTSSELERACDALAEAYEQQRLDVMNFMSTKAIERVRGAAARRLADAFRFRSSDKGTKDG